MILKMEKFTKRNYLSGFSPLLPICHLPIEVTTNKIVDLFLTESVLVLKFMNRRILDDIQTIWRDHILGRKGENQRKGHNFTK
jgi:hypothetical protein